VGDDRKYNEAATRVMKKCGVMTNDLHSLTEGFPADIFIRPGDVHYTEDGYKKIAGQVAESISKALDTKLTTQPRAGENKESRRSKSRDAIGQQQFQF
jgi:hypothetical protein